MKGRRANVNIEGRLTEEVQVAKWKRAYIWEGDNISSEETRVSNDNLAVGQSNKRGQGHTENLPAQH